MFGGLWRTIGSYTLLQPNSPCFEFIYTFLGTGGVGVEIGIAEGGNAEAVLNHIRPSKYYMVDPWKLYPGYSPGSRFTQASFDALYDKARARVSRHPAAEILRMTSEEASQVVPDGLDFVYVDGNHDYDYKKLDLELWYPKIRPGGVLCGDDYNLVAPHNNRDTPRVVQEFCTKHGLSFEVSTDTPPHPLEFWIVKP